MSDKLIIFDTTMRDGEQSPGASMTREEKIRIAKALERMRVDVIEAGFPVASIGDFESVKAVAEVITESTVCALARALEKDIDRAAEAIKPARRGRIHTFIATSPIHMQHKLRMTPDEVLERTVQMVKCARQYTDDVEFSAEDAVRSEMDFLCRVFEAAIKAGARTVNVPDTVGYSIPHAWGERIKTLMERVPNADKAIWSTHCHNDLGLAVANSLSAVLNGARQVECTINGLGERAGNAALEEIVMAVRTRRDIFTCDTGIDATQIVPASRLVSGITGFAVAGGVAANATLRARLMAVGFCWLVNRTVPSASVPRPVAPKNAVSFPQGSGRVAVMASRSRSFAIVKSPLASFAVTTNLREGSTVPPSGSSPVGASPMNRGFSTFDTSIIETDRLRSLLTKAYSVPSTVATSRPSGSGPRLSERSSDTRPKSASVRSYEAFTSARGIPAGVHVV